MGDADGSGILLNILPTRSRGAEDVDLQICRLNRDLRTVKGDLGEDFHQGERSMPPVRGVKWGQAHQTMDTLLRTQITICIFPSDTDGGRFYAGFLAFARIQDFGLIAILFRPAQIHAHEHGGPILGVCAPCAGVDGQQGIIGVIWT